MVRLWGLSVWSSVNHMCARNNPLPAILRAAHIPEVVQQAYPQCDEGVIVVAVAPLCAFPANLAVGRAFHFDGAVGQGNRKLIAELQDVIFVGINGANIIEVVGEEGAGIELQVQAPLVAEVYLEAEAISQAAAHTVVFLTFELPLSAQRAEFYHFPLILRHGVEVENIEAGKQIRGEEFVRVTVLVRQEIELELKGPVDDVAFEAQVTCPFKGIRGVRIGGRDLCKISGSLKAQPLVEIVTGNQSARQPGVTEIIIGIQIPKVEGAADPATGFPALLSMSSGGAKDGEGQYGPGICFHDVHVIQC